MTGPVASGAEPAPGSAGGAMSGTCARGVGAPPAPGPPAIPPIPPPPMDIWAKAGTQEKVRRRPRAVRIKYLMGQNSSALTIKPPEPGIQIKFERHPTAIGQHQQGGYP